MCQMGQTFHKVGAVATESIARYSHYLERAEVGLRPEYDFLNVNTQGNSPTGLALLSISHQAQIIVLNETGLMLSSCKLEGYNHRRYLMENHKLWPLRSIRCCREFETSQRYD